MTKRCNFRVQYGTHDARFSSREHALEYARRMAKRCQYYTEVYAPDGLIGQFRPGTGEPAPEFAHLAVDA